jgi:hypothetical protein
LTNLSPDAAFCSLVVDTTTNFSKKKVGETVTLQINIFDLLGACFEAAKVILVSITSSVLKIDIMKQQKKKEKKKLGNEQNLQRTARMFSYQS